VSLAVVGAAGSHAVGAGLRHVAGDVAEKAGVQIFCEVAVCDAIFGARGLVLVRVVFERFG